MALSPGERFGSYEIAEAIGSGGMGEVYRATDTSLKRDVAVKVLPESFARDADRLARFRREAEILASLNHTNIAHVYGLEHAGDQTVIVMELIEGPTLAERIAQGPLPPDEALGIARQIARALEAAHGARVVHRDLKPANVKIKTDGTVKVLDFGIAKALDAESISGGHSPVMTTPAMTETGIILGTAAYMSPEQARGRFVDQRTDIWAFGCLLFEMLTGQPAFAGEDVMAVLARVIDRDTDFTSMPGTISPAVRHTIKLCLQKDPNKRIADIRDVRLALEGGFETEFLAIAAGKAAAIPLWRRALPVAAVVMVTAAFVGGATWFARQPAPRPVVRFDYDLPEGEFLRALGRSVLAVAPDGRRFAYNGANGIFLREMDELEARLIPGTEELSINLFFSADSQSLAWFGGDGRLRRIAISGGAPVVVADGLVQPFGASWAPDGTIYFGQLDGIYRVSANGGEPERIIAAADAELVYGPRLMPDGDALLFTSSPNGFGSETQVVIESLASGERSVLVDGGADAQYVPTGHLVYALEDGLFAVRFDAATRTVAGGPVPLLQGVWRGTGGAPPAAYGIADDGSLMHLELDGILGQVGSVSDIVWVDRAGVEQPIGMEPCVGCLDLSVSPDGTRVALTVLRQGVQGAGANVWIWSFVSNTLSRLTFDAGIQVFPTWSPDSSRIAFRKIDGLYVRPADGTGEDQQLLQEAANMAPYELAATDELLYSRAGEIGGTEDILVLDPASGGEPRALLATAFVESRPALSPDGRWLAYESDETGQREIYVRPYPEVDSGKWQVSTAGGMQPLWSPDGSRLYYLAEEELMEAEVTTEPAFVRQTPQPLFELRDYQIAAGTLRNYDVAADGERFLMMRQGRGAEGASGSFRVIVVQNWVDELERLVPTE